jgi:glycerol-3-phosphate cytidylyltransferase-like family protein
MGDDKIILLGGGADPTVLGHIKLIEDAAKYGKVIWALNSDSWLKRKKGYVFMKWADRQMVLKSIRYICDVITVDDEDGSIIKAIEQVKPDYFGHGGREYEIPEKSICEKMGIKLVWGLGGDLNFSSGDIVDCMINSLIDKIEPHFKK